MSGPSKMTEQQLMDLGVEVVLAMMSSASTDKISPINWWPRARAALSAGAAAATSFAGMISVMANKLEIECLSNRSAERVRAVELTIGQDFAAFRSLLETQDVYVVALAQIESSQNRVARQAQAASDPVTTGQLDLAPEVTG